MKATLLRGLKILLFLSLVVASKIQAAPLAISEKATEHFWIRQSQSLTLSPAYQRMAAASQAAIKKYGHIYVTMDYTIELSGKVSNVVVLKIEPAEVDPKPFAALMTLAKFAVAPNAKPTIVRVHVQRQPHWIPKDLQ